MAGTGRDTVIPQLRFKKRETVKMNRKLSALVMLAGLAGFCGAQTAGQAKPNFSGTWKLTLQKSDLGQFAPTSETDTITQTADELKIEVASESQRGKRDTTTTAKLDGTDTPNPAAANSVFQILSTKATWQGSSLVITQTTSFQDSKGTMTATYTLSDDGKTLTKTTHAVFNENAFDSKSVYDKA